MDYKINTMTDKVQLIKEEIERRLSNLWYLIPEGEKVLKDDFTKDDANNLGKYTALENLLQFIDSIPEESGCEVNFTTKSEDLEEEIKLVALDYEQVNVEWNNDFDFIARHFAEWQKQKDQETIELAEDHAMLAGMMKEREEMMKDAVDVKVNLDLDGNIKLDCEYEFHVGDKVKIVVLKTE